MHTLKKEEIYTIFRLYNKNIKAKRAVIYLKGELVQPGLCISVYTLSS